MEEYLRFKLSHNEQFPTRHREVEKDFLRPEVQEAAKGWANIPAIMKSLRIFEFVEYYEDEKFHHYKYRCIYDPLGNKLGTFHIVRKDKPIKPLRITVQTLGRKIYQYHIGHYDPQKQKELMKRYKEGKLKSRPNGQKWCPVQKGDRWETRRGSMSASALYSMNRVNLSYSFF